MSVYNNAIPQPTDFLSVSQQDILNNFSQADISFGIDHYTFSDGTANNGKHNQVTTPIITGAAHPSTAADEPKFYAMKDSTNLGTLQYSRGPSDAVTTPITKLQSTAAAITLAPTASTNILDFTGLPNSILRTVFFAIRTTGANAPENEFYDYLVRWNPAAPSFFIQEIFAGGSLILEASGNILRIRNTSAANTRGSLFWTVEFHRIWT